MARRGGTVAIDAYSPQGNSVFGVAGLCGNVREWTSTLYEKSGANPDDDLFLACGSAFDHLSTQQDIPLNWAYKNHATGFRVVYDDSERAEATRLILRDYVSWVEGPP